MDALDEYLESLAGLDPEPKRGSFTLARGELWARLKKTVPDGRHALRFLLRWLHARQAQVIAIESRRDRLTLTASFLEAPVPKTFDFSGRDLDLARALVGAGQLSSAPWSLELDDGAVRYSQRGNAPDDWQTMESQGRREVVARVENASSLITSWAEQTSHAFRHSPIVITWNQRVLSAPYAFPYPVLVWRQLRPQSGERVPLQFAIPSQALEFYCTSRHEEIDVVMGLSADGSSRPVFEMLRHGELLTVHKAEVELAGFGGILQSERVSTDLGGENLVASAELAQLLTTLRHEALDMVLQLYNRDSPLTPEQADGAFHGLLSVLLHLLDQQRFAEGHLLAEWMGPSLAAGQVLRQFRYGYTFDRLRSLLAEPAGHPQTALRWHKQAEARLRSASGSDRELAAEALLISARLELRARRDNPQGLSGHLQARLLQLAQQTKARGDYPHAASIFLMLGQSFAPGHPERLEHLIQAADCCPRPPYSQALAKEKALGGEAPSRE